MGNILNLRSVTVVVVFACILINGLWYPDALGAQSSQWTIPVNISSPSEVGWNPAIVADSEGVVHIIWTSDRSGQVGARGDTIFYSKWVNGAWAKPASILISPAGGTAMPALCLDNKGWLHVVWQTGGTYGRSPLYYSRAPAQQADKAGSWSPTKLMAGEVVWSDIKSDKNGAVFLVYADRPSAAITLITSTDSGQSWSKPTVIAQDSTLGPNEDISRPRLAIGSKGDLHVVWVRDSYTPDRPYSGRVLSYARSRDGGVTWSQPYVVDSVVNSAYGDQTPAEWINVAVDSVGRVHLVWDGPKGYRYHQWSNDGGNTWNKPTMILPRIGYTGWNALAVDSEDGLNMVATTIDGVFYMRWKNGTWSSPITTGAEASMHYPALVANLGNQLFLVYQNHGGNVGTGGLIKNQRLDLPIPSIATKPVATVELASVQATTTPTSTPTTHTPTRTVLPPFQSSDAMTPPSDSTSVPLLMGLLPVAIIIGLVVLVRFARFSH